MGDYSKFQDERLVNGPHICSPRKFFNHLNSLNSVSRLFDQTLDLQSLSSLEKATEHVLVDEDLAGVHVLHQAGHVLVLDVGQQHHLLRAGSGLQILVLLLRVYISPVKSFSYTRR